MKRILSLPNAKKFINNKDLILYAIKNEGETKPDFSDIRIIREAIKSKEKKDSSYEKISFLTLNNSN